MKLIRKIKDIKYNIEYKFQRAKKGYCDNDLFSIYDWFMEIFPKMLEEFVECTCGNPGDEEELIKEVSKMPELWVEEQRSLVNKYLEKYDDKFDTKDGFCCWLIIILRMKYCFERCDEWHNYYEIFRETNDYDGLDDALTRYKKEAFYLFEKWFYALWW